jgi:HAD superfamily hydrolase (TIGR01509 family)
MSLKVVLFDFNGVIVNDLALHLELIDRILIQENLQPQKPQERQASLGQSDRVYFQELLQRRGRVVSREYLNQLLSYKAQAYILELAKLEKLPLYSGVEDLIFQVRASNVKIGLVSGALRQEIDVVLERAKLAGYFQVIVSGDDLLTSKPEPEGYLLGVERFNQEYPDLNLQFQECLAIEDTPAGIKAAKCAQIKVVGVANTYPFHMLQRQANWTVDYLIDLELERVYEVYSRRDGQPTLPEC